MKTYLIFLLLFISGCATKQQYDGHYKIGPVYNKNGIVFVPQDDKKYEKTGLASWYGKKGGFHGRKTANGEKFNSNMLTAAHPTLPMPSIVKVTNLKNSKTVILMVNDRGPFKKNRILDVSEKAADILGFKQHGVAKVKVIYLPEETKALHHKLSIKPKHGAKPHGKIKNPRCHVDCFVKELNKKSNIKL